MLDSENFDIFLHIDKKAINIPFNLLKMSVLKSHLYFLDSISVSWGGPSQVVCILKLLEAAHTNYNYSYYHLISGSDLPLHCSNDIWNYFNSSYGIEYVAIKHDSINGNLSQNELSRVYTYRIFPECGRTQPFYLLANTLTRIQTTLHLTKSNNSFSGITLGKGAEWFSITNDFCEWLLERKNTIINIFCNHTFCADEMFVQSMLLSSPFVNKRFHPLSDEHDQCMRLIDWQRGTPYIWRITDLNTLLTSNRMFARKFDEKIDSKVIYALYDRIKGVE